MGPMRSLRALTRAAILSLALPAAACGDSPAANPAGAAVPADHAASVQAWRDKHEQDYRHEYVSIAGLHPLEPGAYTLGSSPGNRIVISPRVPPTIGRVTVEGGRVQFDPLPGVPVLFDGNEVNGPIVLKEPDAAPAGELTVGNVRVVVHQSGERLWLRVRDPEGDLATGFAGFTWFPIDPSYRVVARFIRDPEPRAFQVVTTFNDLTTYTSEGVVEFELQGRTLRLRPFTTRPGRLYFVFRDASSGEETYGTGRFLYADLQEDGTVVLDFNQAYNPPCAFNPYTTCPIPLKENDLPVKILAGERDYAG